ncbi:hypothetical protein D3C81_1518560 [compost metagenome]
MIGTRAMSGSEAIRFRKRTIAAFESSMASSMLMSMICAPFSTCWRATASASSNWPFRIIRAKALEPVTLVRSPTLTNSVSSSMVKGSRPDRRIGRGGSLFSLMFSGSGSGGVAVLAGPGAGFLVGHALGDGGDMLGGGAAAAAHQVHQPGSGELLDQR